MLLSLRSLGNAGKSPNVLSGSTAIAPIGTPRKPHVEFAVSSFSSLPAALGLSWDPSTACISFQTSLGSTPDGATVRESHTDFDSYCPTLQHQQPLLAQPPIEPQRALHIVDPPSFTNDDCFHDRVHDTHVNCHPISHLHDDSLALCHAHAHTVVVG